MKEKRKVEEYQDEEDFYGLSWDEYLVEDWGLAED